MKDGIICPKIEPFVQKSRYFTLFTGQSFGIIEVFQPMVLVGSEALFKLYYE